MQRRLLPPLTLVLLTSGLILSAQDDKTPFMVVELAGGAGVFAPQHSSTTAPTIACPDGFPNSPVPLPCSEQLSRTHSGLLEISIRPWRYFEAGTTVGILGNFNNYKSFAVPYQCVSGCTGVVNAKISQGSVLVTLDGRGVLPMYHERLLLSGGVGIAWLENSYHADAGSAKVQGRCLSCPFPSGGHGLTELAEITYLPAKHFGVGLQVRNVGIRSAGLTVAAGPVGGNAITYKDRFLLIGGLVSFRFGTHR